MEDWFGLNLLRFVEIPSRLNFGKFQRNNIAFISLKIAIIRQNWAKLLHFGWNFGLNLQSRVYFGYLCNSKVIFYTKKINFNHYIIHQTHGRI